VAERRGIKLRSNATQEIQNLRRTQAPFDLLRAKGIGFDPTFDVGIDDHGVVSSFLASFDRGLRRPARRSGAGAFRGRSRSCRRSGRGRRNRGGPGSRGAGSTRRFGRRTGAARCAGGGLDVQHQGAQNPQQRQTAAQPKTTAQPQTTAQRPTIHPVRHARQVKTVCCVVSLAAGHESRAKRGLKAPHATERMHPSRAPLRGALELRGDLGARAFEFGLRIAARETRVPAPNDQRNHTNWRPAVSRLRGRRGQDRPPRGRRG